MSFTTYSTRGGESWAEVARSVYGTPDGGKRIALSNPGASEPLPAGLRLQVPPREGAPGPLPRSGETEPDAVELRIAGERFRWWSSVTIRRALDSVDTVSVSAPFEPDRPEFRRAFRPLSYQRVTVAVGGDPLFAGTLLSVSPDASPDGRTVSAGGYSLPGVLGDCTPSSAAESLEFIELDLGQIARQVLEPFGLAITFEGGAQPGAAFPEVSISATEPVLPFLARLAKQRGLVIGSDRSGALAFRRSTSPGRPVAVLSAEQAGPVTAVVPFFQPQQYFSHLTGLEPQIIGGDGERVTVRNARLDAIRPHTFTVPDAEGGDLEAAVQAKAGRMFGDAVAYEVDVSTWRDPAGRLWAPNTTLRLSWPGAMIYRPFEFLVRSVELTATATERSAVLSLVMPGAYSGEVPEVLPWD